MNKKAGQKRSPVSWLMELAAPRRWEYLVSVRTALAGVGIELLDHLVFVDGDMVSMRDSGMMK